MSVGGRKGKGLERQALSSSAKLFKGSRPTILAALPAMMTTAPTPLQFLVHVSPLPSVVALAMAFSSFLLLLASAAVAIAIDYFYRRQPWISRTQDMPSAITDRVDELCHGKQSVSSLLAEDPALPPRDAVHRLYSTHPVSVLDSRPPKHRHSATPEELDRAFHCGNFGQTKPSDLFLRIWNDALCTLDHDPLAGVVSPPLMGSSGIVPLSIISSLPDICRHMVCRITHAPTLFLTAPSVKPHRQSSARSHPGDQLLERV